MMVSKNIYMCAYKLLTEVEKKSNAKVEEIIIN